MQAAAHHAENVAGLPHATADPVHIAAGQDALPPVGSAAYAGGELRGHAPKAQTGEKSNINARGCASEMQQRQGHRIGSSCLCRILHRGKASSRFPEGAAHPLPVLLPVLLLQHAPLHGGKVAGNRPEVGAYHPVGHFGVDLGGGNVLVPEYLGECLDGAAVAEIDGRGEGVAAQVEADLLVDAAGFGYPFEVGVAHAVAGHGEDKVAPGKPPVPLYQLLGNLHEGNVARHTGLGAPGDDPFLAVEVHALYLVMGERLYINVAKPGETPEEEHVPHEAGLFLDEHGVSQGAQLLFREIAPVGLLHFKAVLSEGVGADDSTPPRLVGQAEQGHGVYPEGVGTQPFLYPQVLVEIGDDLLGQLLVSHVGALLLLPKEGLEMVVNSQILVVGGLGSLSFLHHRPELPVHVPEVFEDAVLHHADTEEGVAQLLGGNEILFPEDAVVVVGEPGGDLLQLPVYLVCLGGLAFRLAVLPEVGSDEQLGSHRLVISVNGDFHHDRGFTVPGSHCGSLDVERGRKRTSLCFHNSKIFVSKGSYLFLTKSYAKQGKAMKQNSLCRIYSLSEPVAV